MVRSPVFKKEFGTLILPDGTTNDVAPLNGKHFKLQEIYDLLHCDIVQMLGPYRGKEDRGFIMLLDEEGKLKPNPEPNWKATLIAQKFGISPYDTVTGRVLYCPGRLFK